MKTRSDNTSGFPGVYRFRNGWRFYPWVPALGKNVYMGYFPTRKRAITAAEKYYKTQKDIASL